jgi:hypothetical protein
MDFEPIHLLIALIHRFPLIVVVDVGWSLVSMIMWAITSNQINGLTQGDLLLPMLFNIVSDHYCVHKKRRPN